MMIKPSTSLRNEYNEISSYCKQNKQPVFLTKNGEGDLVVMSMRIFRYIRFANLLKALSSYKPPP